MTQTPWFALHAHIHQNDIKDDLAVYGNIHILFSQAY